MPECPAPAMRRFDIDFGGKAVTFEAGHDDVARRLARLIDGWHVGRATGDTAFTVRFGRSCGPLDPPQAGEIFEVDRGECYVVAGGELRLRTGDAWIIVHPPPQLTIDVHIGDETAACSSAFARAVFYAVQAALRRVGLFELHAAALMPPSGASGVLFVGPSGSGKSTIAMSLATAGWSHIGDDIVLLCETPASLSALAFRRVFAATPATLRAFPSPRLDEAVRPSNGYEPAKVRFDPEVLYPGTSLPSCTPGTVVFTSIAAVPSTESRQLSPSKGLTRLIEMCPWACYDASTAREHLAVLGSLARGCRSYELRAGRDLLDDPSAASRVIAAMLG